MATACSSSSAASAPAGSNSLVSSVDSIRPPAPVLRRKPQSKGNVGAGKLYANHAAFQADVDAWNLEQAEHRKKMAERKRDLDKQRDRSGRQRGNEEETDSERVVRQRQENAAAADNHAQQQAAQRRKSRFREQQARFEQQQAWIQLLQQNQLLQLQLQQLRQAETAPSIIEWSHRGKFIELTRKTADGWRLYFVGDNDGHGERRGLRSDDTARREAAHVDGARWLFWRDTTTLQGWRSREAPLTGTGTGTEGARELGSCDCHCSERSCPDSSPNHPGSKRTV